MSHTLLIDANSITHAAQRATRLTCGNMETQAVFGMLKTMLKMREQYRQYTPMILWDGRAEWRFTLHPDYKSNRTNDVQKVKARESLAIQKPFIKRALSALGVRQMTARFHEADDLAGYFIHSLSADPANKIGLITGDQDWLQLVRPNVFWRDLRDDARLVTTKNFYDFTGCKTPFAFLETKILTGDSSDVISGVGKIGEKGAPEFIAEFGSVREFWRRCDSGEFKPTKAAHINLATGPGRAIYKRNFQLMQLLHVSPPKKEDVEVDKGKFDKEAFAAVCEELGFVSILRNLDQYTNSFQ